MTPKEKAIYLIQKFSGKLPWYSEKDNFNKSKQCALIVVDEILNSGKDVDEFCDSYWQEVKQEIIKSE